MFDLFWSGLNRPDFNETFVHHLCTLSLAVCSTLMNNRGTSLTCAYVHAMAEIPVNFGRIFSSTPYNTATVISSIFLIFTWLYTRLIVFGYYTYRYWTREFPAEMDQYNLLYKAEALFCTVLVCLHIHWFRLIVLMVLNYKKTGSNTDLQMQVKKQK